MAEYSVRFRRERADGLVVNFWIKYPQTGWKRLRFNNERARADLKTGVAYTLFWDAFGAEGDEFKVERKIVGLDADFKLLLEWKLPDEPDIPPGVPVRYREKAEFTLEGE